MSKDPLTSKAEVNIGIIGHVDHGKTTLVQALTGEWTDRHSEEIKRGISIKLGYADMTILKCPDCPPPQCYSTPALSPKNKCVCGKKLEFVRKISFVDAPGHEILMATTISGVALMDAAILVIAANEPCPQPQTREHYEALRISGIENFIIAQNKIELISPENAMSHYESIKEFIGPELQDKVPIIPISAIHKANLDLLIQTIEEKVPTPKKTGEDSFMYIARSFDVNKPGVKPDELRGGVVAGTISRGKIKIGDSIEIRPGISRKDINGKTIYKPLITEVMSLHAGEVGNLEEVDSGGLIGVETRLDPALTKSDGMIGNVAGTPETLPPVRDELNLSVKLLQRVVGSKEQLNVEKIKQNELLMLNVGASTTVGVVSTIGKKNTFKVDLKRPVCAAKGQKIAISRQILNRWRLIGYGILN